MDVWFHTIDCRVKPIRNHYMAVLGEKKKTLNQRGKIPYEFVGCDPM